MERVLDALWISVCQVFCGGAFVAMVWGCVKYGEWINKDH